MSARRAILVASACSARTACVRSPWNVPVRPAASGGGGEEAGGAMLLASACGARPAGVRSPWNVPVRPAGAGDSEAWVSGVRFAFLGTLMLADGGGDPVAVAGARQRAIPG